VSSKELKGDAAVIVEAPDPRQAMRQIEQNPDSAVGHPVRWRRHPSMYSTRLTASLLLHACVRSWHKAVQDVCGGLSALGESRQGKTCLASKQGDALALAVDEFVIERIGAGEALKIGEEKEARHAACHLLDFAQHVFRALRCRCERRRCQRCARRNLRVALIPFVPVGAIVYAAPLLS
jgi:hypothetical protein